MFTRDDARWLSDIVNAFYAAQTPAQLAAAAIAMAHQRFRVVATVAEEIAFDGSRCVAHGVRCDTAFPADYAAFIHDHPIFPMLHSGGVTPVLQIAKMCSRSAYERTDHFNGLARPVGFSDQLMTVVRDTSAFFHVGLSRDRSFTESEHELMTLVHAHLHASWHRVRQPGENLPGSLRLELSPGLLPRRMNAAQQAVLRAYFPAWRETHALPGPLRDWLTYSLRDLRSPAPTRPLRAFVVDSARGRLLVRCFPSAAGGPIRLSFVEIPARPDFFQLRSRGLTDRECEVLHWVVQGKRDSEIALIIGAAAKTVSKHMERVLHKLRSENRATAAKTAVNWLRSA